MEKPFAAQAPSASMAPWKPTTARTMNLFSITRKRPIRTIFRQLPSL